VVRPAQRSIFGVLVALAVGVGACAGSQTDVTSPVPTAPVSAPTAATLTIAPTATPTGPAELQTFASNIYAYTMDYPVGWSANGALRQLRNGEMPIDSQTATDKFTRNPAKDLDPLIFISAQAVPEGISLERWGAFTVKVASPHVDCQPARQESIKVGSEPAVLFIYECGGGFVLWTALVHGNQGYDIVLLGGPGDEEAADRAVYNRLLATVAFTN
jgi:hypothetical protein